MFDYLVLDEIIQKLLFHFRAMLSLGSSKPWPEAMEVLTGTRKMDASALLEYFKPLNDFLTKRNKETGAHIGWEKSDSE